jgi:hypothetical protein
MKFAQKCQSDCNNKLEPGMQTCSERESVEVEMCTEIDLQLKWCIVVGTPARQTF